MIINSRSIFGNQKIQRRLSDNSEDDELEEENRSKIKSELPEERKPTRRKATDILAEVTTFPHVKLYNFINKSQLVECKYLLFSDGDKGLVWEFSSENNLLRYLFPWLSSIHVCQKFIVSAIHI